MDFSSLLVLLLVLSTFGLLVWIELRSRRNQRALAASSQDEVASKEQLQKRQ